MSPTRTKFPDVHEIREASTDSNSSVGTGSPTLLNPDSLDVCPSLGSSHGTPTVKFAPLPQIDPNRKRSLVPLGVSGRSRRKRPIQREAGSLLWSTDPDLPEENMEDPLIVFAKFVKKTGKTLWRTVRKGSKVVAAPQENVSRSTEPVLDIRSTVRPGDMMALEEKGERVSEVVGGEDKEGRRASWSPSDKRRTLSLSDEAKRKSTTDLAHLRVVV